MLDNIPMISVGWVDDVWLGYWALALVGILSWWQILAMGCLEAFFKLDWLRITFGWWYFQTGAFVALLCVTAVWVIKFILYKILSCAITCLIVWVFQRVDRALSFFWKTIQKKGGSILSLYRSISYPNWSSIYCTIILFPHLQIWWTLVIFIVCFFRKLSRLYSVACF